MPIDVISGEEFENMGTFDLNDVIPGFVLDVGLLFQALYVD